MFESKLTKQALEVLSSFEPDVLDVWELLEHDGYDSVGPKSNLWDLYIVDSKGILHHFHREWWFQGDDKENYQEVE